MIHNKICLLGASGAGKDWVCSEIIKRHQEFVRLSFSDALKEICHDVFDWMKRDYTPEEKEKPLNVETSFGEIITLSPREIWLKMNFLREIENNIFVRKLYDELKELEFQGVENFIISDLRTKPELDFVKQNGFKIIKIVNPINYHPENDFDRIQNSKEFLDAIDHIYENRIGKSFNEQEFFCFSK